jgi:hypothetical protein
MTSELAINALIVQSHDVGFAHGGWVHRARRPRQPCPAGRSVSSVRSSTRTWASLPRGPVWLAQRGHALTIAHMTILRAMSQLVASPLFGFDLGSKSSSLGLVSSEKLSNFPVS